MLEGAVSQMHEVCCGDWGAPPCYNMEQVVLVITSLLSYYRCEKGKGDLVKASIYCKITNSITLYVYIHIIYFITNI